MKFEPNPARSKGYVLVVDVPNMAELIAEWLRKAGYVTKFAHTYAAAKVIANECPPKLFTVNTTLREGMFTDIVGEIYWRGDKNFPEAMHLWINQEDIYGPKSVVQYGFCWYEMIIIKPFNPRELIYYIDKILSLDPYSHDID
ncbi:MAG: hypothetical protein QM758_26265 [Armatimonas sp.]